MAPTYAHSPTFKYMAHHVFLPPKLPQKDDYHASYEHGLLCAIVDASKLTHDPFHKKLAY